MPFAVLVTDAAVRDLDELYDYIALHNSPGKAEYVAGQIANVFSSLAELPERGAHPRELSALGMREYREIFFKPYRIIYRILEQKVYILLVADGRRDMQTLLQRRLLEA